MTKQCDSDAKAMRDRLAKRARKIGMLVEANRHPEQSQKIRTNYKRREKLTEMKQSLQQNRSQNK